MSDPDPAIRALLEIATEGIVVADLKGRIVAFNATARHLTGAGDEGESSYQFFRSDRTTPFPAAEMPLVRALRGETSDRVEMFVRHPANETGNLLSVSGRPLRDGSGRVTGGVITISDVTLMRRYQERVGELATRDGLTDLPNHRAFKERLALHVAEAHRKRRFALVMADLDLFKLINDRHGLAVGDRVLIAVAEALVKAVRNTDFVARYGGEEFGVLLTDLGPDDAARVSETMRMAVDSIREPVPVTASFGVCVFSPERHSLADEVIRDADIALHAAKRDGRNRVSVFKP